MGETLPYLYQRRGDFEDWITAPLEKARVGFSVVSPYREDLPSDPTDFAGVIISGSHTMVTDRETWREQTAAWILRVMESAIPLLGICYGHQLLAHASHTQTVTQLPLDALHLASSKDEPHHAFAMGPCAWGVQFHPEFDAHIMKTYVHTFAELMNVHGQNPDKVIKEIVETPLSQMILTRFVDITISRQTSDNL